VSQVVEETVNESPQEVTVADATVVHSPACNGEHGVQQFQPEQLKFVHPNASFPDFAPGHSRTCYRE